MSQGKFSWHTHETLMRALMKRSNPRALIVINLIKVDNRKNNTV